VNNLPYDKSFHTKLKSKIQLLQVNEFCSYCICPLQNELAGKNGGKSEQKAYKPLPSYLINEQSVLK